MRELTQEVELAVVKEVVGLLLQPQLLTQVRHVQQLPKKILLLEASCSAAQSATLWCAVRPILFIQFLSEGTELRSCTLCA
jgi:hypothetical protein